MRANNDINRGTGEFVLIGNTAVNPNAYQGTTLIATSSVVDSATGQPRTLDIDFVGSPSIPSQVSDRLAYSPTDPANAYEIQPWTFTYTNGTSTETQVTPSLVGVAPPPFASNVTFSGLSAQPTFTWSYPAGSIDGVFFDIYDATDLTTAGIAALVYSASLTGNTGKFTVPTALNGGLTLQLGHHYVLDLYGVVSRDPSQPLSNANSESWSESYFDFEPFAGQSSPTVYLPTITGNGAYSFTINVVAGQTYSIDPAIATGYSYATGAGNPNFASVLLPTIQTSDYLVTFTSDGVQQTDQVAPGTVFNFPTGGVSSFLVTGISAADALNPTDPTAFVTGLTFVSSGEFTGTQTPLVDPGPTAGAVSSAATLGQTVDLTSAILAQVTPGLIGDTETITGVGPTADGGQVTLINGGLSYTAQSSVLKHIPANGSLTDSFTYTVTDQLGDAATGTVQVTVSNPAVVINGKPFGFDTIHGGTQTNIVNAFGYFNTIDEHGGNDVVNAGAGLASVNTGSGDVVVNLQGVLNQVNGGNGNDTVNIKSGGLDWVSLGTGTDTITDTPQGLGGDTFVLSGSTAAAILYGYGDQVFVHGGTDALTDNAQGLLVDIDSKGGSVTLTNFLADHSGRIELSDGVGGYTSVRSVQAALQSDGHGGTMLSLGAAGQIDFAGVQPGQLKAYQFVLSGVGHDA